MVSMGTDARVHVWDLSKWLSNDWTQGGGINP